jgi:hypothetical protein
VQEPEQEWCADQGGDHADWHANGASDGVGEEQEERPTDRREWQHGAWVGADGEAGKVRHHEAHEPDETGEGDS